VAYNTNGDVHVGTQAEELADDLIVFNPYRKYFFPDY
jgi:hypothetical protein